MKLRKLLELLSDYDEDAEIRIMSQPSWPFEIAIKDIVSRSDLEQEEDKDFDGRESPMNCVFIVEGSQMRYGDKDAWR